MDMEFSMADVSAIIMGGKNGYGKTTIFDAIELLLTGMIERYNNYAEELVDHRRGKNDFEKPLVCDDKVPDVQIDVYASSVVAREIKHYRLTRKALVADMENPVRFPPFEPLYICFPRGEMHPITRQELETLGIEKLSRHYSTLNYLSQEEATLFIKSSDADRANAIQYLFNTKRFDERIEKLDKLILKGVKYCLDELKSEQENLKSRIGDLLKYRTASQENPTAFVQLFKEDAQVTWDWENVRLSNEEYHGLLTENGLIDQLLYLVCHREDVRKYRKDIFLNSVHEKSAELALYWQYRSRKALIKLYEDFNRKVVGPCEALELSQVERFQLNLPAEINGVVSQENVQMIVEALERVRGMYRSASMAERAYNEMLGQRNRMEQHLKAHASELEQSSCPLCGQQYGETQSLLENIARTTSLQAESARVFSDQAAQELVKIKSMMHDNMIVPVMVWFEEQGITKGIVARYLELDAASLELQLMRLIKANYISEAPGDTEQLSELLLKKVVAEQKEELDDTIDYPMLMNLHNSYGKLMTKEGYNEQSVMLKRAYLLMKWSQQQSAQLKELQIKQAQCEAKTEMVKVMNRKLKTLKEEIVRQKNEWIKKVVGDVEILFYIYTGRIMQDNFFGRGLFMKIEPDKYVYFVSDYRSDLDALYKMSSGQLVALMMSLLLSLNKLYSTEKFIAIDDPVQTIDDINVWGFIETLRHEFNDYQILLSTHELSYGSLLRYKLSKMGIATEYRDMLQERQKRITQ